MTEVSFRGVLFDMDGTLTPNAHFHHEAWTECLLERYGYHLAPDDPRVHGGKTWFILESVLGRSLPANEAHEFHEWKEARYRELARGRIQAMPGLLEYLDWLEARNVQVAIVTSADRTNTEFVLGALGLESRFLVRVLGEDVQNGKPHPEPFLTGAAKLGLDPRECIAHEDALVGVKSALGAGARVAAITSTQPEQALLEVGAAWAVPDFAAWLEVVRGFN